MRVLLHHLDLHRIKSTVTDRPTLQREKPKANLVLYIGRTVADQDRTKGARAIGRYMYCPGRVECPIPRGKTERGTLGSLGGTDTALRRQDS